jgi:DNA-binding LacI/PurR family transcriptional regulator
MPITVNELAKIARVSPSTVSRALRDSPQISEETKKRIRLLAERFNCRPNRLAEGFFSGNAKCIGVIVPDTSYSFYSKIIRGIEVIALPRGYGIMVFSSLNKPEFEKQYLQMLTELRVWGIIIAATQDVYTADYVRELQKEHIPIVAIDRRIKGLGANFVGTDDTKGAYEAVRYLIELGHRRIAYVRGPEEFSSSVDRMNGYNRALNVVGIPFDKQLVTRGASFMSDDESNKQLIEGRAAAQTLMSIENPPTAIFCVNDYVAVGVYKQLREMGLSVPKDVSLIGYADLEVSQLLDVPLTTVRQPMEDIGKKAADMVIELKDNTSPMHFEKCIVDVELIVRMSTGPVLS